MSQPEDPAIDGIHAPAPRLTVLGTAVLSACIAVPAGSVVGLLAWIAGY